MMINQKLLDYIQRQAEKGKDKNYIKSSLLSVGWQESDIEESFRVINDNQKQATKEPPPVPLSVQVQENHMITNSLELSLKYSLLYNKMHLF